MQQPINWKVTTGVATIVGVVVSTLSVVITILSTREAEGGAATDAATVFMRLATECLRKALQQ